MKKAILTLLFFVIAYINVSADVPEKIKVGLYFNSSAPESVNLSYDGQDITVNKDDISDENVYTSSDGVIKVNGKSYRGSIILKRIDGGNLTVINEVDIESYVAAVISKEMSSGFELEALKAQAVCARTYAIVNINKHSKYGFSVCDKIDCQVYGGKDSESEKTVKATQETKGKILTYQGKAAQTVYFATSGGYTENVKYVWGSDIPYLIGVSDEYESSDCYAHTWTKELSPEKATEILAKKGYEIGNVQKIEILDETETGAVYKLKVTGDKGEKIFTNESCRTLFGYDILLSQAYTVSQGSGVTLKTYSGDANTANLSVISADGVSTYSGNTLYLKGTEERTMSTPTPSSNFVFKGRGNGHLVGMSQNGANGMAKAGFTYDKILTHYYTGAEISS